VRRSRGTAAKGVDVDRDGDISRTGPDGARRPRKTLVVVLALAVVAAGFVVSVTRTTPGIWRETSAPGSLAASTTAGADPAVAGRPATSDAAQEGAPRPRVVVADGEPVPVLAAPPASAVAYYDAAVVTSGAIYRVTFEVWGWAPPEGGTERLVLRVLSSSAPPGDAKARDLEGANLVVACDPDAAKAIAVGGRYRGSVRMMPRDTLVVVRLIDAVRIER
jgi:hypothetical protein